MIRSTKPAVVNRLLGQIDFDLANEAIAEPWQLLGYLDDLNTLESLDVPIPRRLRRKCLAAYRRLFAARMQLADRERTAREHARNVPTYQRCRSCGRRVTMPCVACGCAFLSPKSLTGKA